MDPRFLLGIKLPQNFNAPYAAENVADFWRRWHITLSNWLRDYLYFRCRECVEVEDLHLCEPGDHDGHRRALGWRELDFRDLGIAAWYGPGGRAPVAAQTGTAKATGLWNYFILSRRSTSSPSRGSSSAPPTSKRLVDFVAHRLSDSFLCERQSPDLFVLGVGVLAHYVPKTLYDFSLDVFVRAPFYAQAMALAMLAIGLQYVAHTGATPFI